MEKGWASQGLEVETKVYIGAISELELQKLQGILNDKEFREIKTSSHRSLLLRRYNNGGDEDLQSLHITVPRESGTQDVDFELAADFMPFKKTLKPFDEFLTNLLKQKLPMAASEVPNNCEAP